MLPWMVLALGIYLAAVLDTALADGLAVGQVGPDFLCLVGIVWLMTQPRRRALTVMGGCGLLADLLAEGSIGVGVAAMRLVGQVMLQNPAGWQNHGARVWGVGLATACVACLVLWGQQFLGQASGTPGAGLVVAMGIGFYTALVSVPLLLSIAWLPKAVGH